MANVRAWVFIEPKVYKEIQGYAKSAGVKTNVFMNMAVVIGARALARATNPEKFITPEMMAEIIKAQNEETNIQQP